MNEYITAANTLFNDPNNTAFSLKFDECQNHLTSSLKELLFYVSRRSTILGRTLSMEISSVRDNPSIQESKEETNLFRKTSRTKFVTSRVLQSKESQINKQLDIGKKTIDSEISKSAGLDNSLITSSNSNDNDIDKDKPKSEEKHNNSERHEFVQRIVETFQQSIPEFNGIWQKLPSKQRDNIKNKIFSELATYHISILQSIRQDSVGIIQSNRKSSPKVRKSKSKKDIKDIFKTKSRRNLSGYTKIFGNDINNEIKLRSNSNDELKRIADMNSPNDFGNMTLRIRTLNRTDSKFKIIEDNLSIKFADNIIQFIHLSNKAAKDIENYKSSYRNQLIEYKNISKEHLRSFTEICKNMIKEEKMMNSLIIMFNHMDREFTNSQDYHFDAVDSSILRSKTKISIVKKNCITNLNRLFKHLYFGSSQILHQYENLSNYEKQNDDDKNSSTLFLLSLIDASIKYTTRIMSILETIHFVSSSENPNQPTFIASLRDKQRRSNEMLKLNDDQIGDTNNLFRPGTINQLLMRLIHSNNVEYEQVFIESYTSFMTTSSLIEKLYNIVVHRDLVSHHNRVNILRRIAEILLSIVERCYKDELDEVPINKVKELLGELAKTVEVSHIIKDILKIISAEKEKEFFKTDFELPKEIVILSNMSMDFNEPNVIAHQLSKITLDIYKNIAAYELKNQAWNREKLKGLSVNVIDLIQRTNVVSFWVAMCILSPKKSKDRAKILTKMIMIAKELKDMKDYNTFMGIIAGLNMSCISRLKLTFSHVNKKYLDILKNIQEVVDPRASFKNLRETIKHGGRNQIPYIGMYLTDLTFMDDGNPDFVVVNGVRMINMEKYKLISNCIKSFRLYQESNIDIDIKDPPYSLLYEIPNLSEAVLHNLSLEREPKSSD